MSTRRERFRKCLHPTYLPFYDALCEALPEHWQPYWGLRTFDEQAHLYAQGRDRPGRVVTNSRAGESAHNYGCASDWTIWQGGQPLWPSHDDPAWKEYEQALEKLGLRWGGNWVRFRDPFHNELALSITWKELNGVRVSHGEDAAKNRIRETLVV